MQLNLCRNKFGHRGSVAEKPVCPVEPNSPSVTLNQGSHNISASRQWIHHRRLAPADSSSAHRANGFIISASRQRIHHQRNAPTDSSSAHRANGFIISAPRQRIHHQRLAPTDSSSAHRANGFIISAPRQRNGVAQTGIKRRDEHHRSEGSAGHAPITEKPPNTGMPPMPVGSAVWVRHRFPRAASWSPRIRHTRRTFDSGA